MTNYKKMDAWLSLYEKDYPKIVSCLRKAHRSSDLSQFLKLVDEARGLATEKGVSIFDR